jgi:carbon monoxide dehydrogenase subunit G
MELRHSIHVPVGVEQAWEVLLDIERIAPCMPGAAIDSVDGDDFTGTVKVKVGPIGLTYKGKASFVERDVASHRAVIEARGRDTRGNGSANATVTALLTGDETSTQVSVMTELDVTGKPAQLGRGMLEEVGAKLIGQFADSLARTLEPGRPVAPDAGEGPQAAHRVPTLVNQPTNDSIDLGRTVLPIAAKRVAPYALPTVLIVAVLWLVRRPAKKGGLRILEDPAPRQAPRSDCRGHV